MARVGKTEFLFTLVICISIGKSCNVIFSDRAESTIAKRRQR